MDNAPFLSIGNRTITNDDPCFIIAEAGSNHNQDLQLAYQLIDAAVESKADAVKFQLFQADKIASCLATNATKLNDTFKKYGDTLFELYQKLETPRDWVPKLAQYCDKKNIIFLCTPFDYEAVEILENIDIKGYKIASFELVDLPLLQYIAEKQKPIILSTGMAKLGEVEEAIETVEATGNSQIALLHCGIEYPLSFDNVNLRAMDTLKHSFNRIVGYSDHTSGITVPIAAVARGAKIIEKHFTLDKSYHGPDHFFALNPVELADMVSAIRNTESALGTALKGPVMAEMENLKRGRRSLFAKIDINKGCMITDNMITALRPGTGLHPRYYGIVLGRTATKSILKGEPITWDCI